MIMKSLNIIERTLLSLLKRVWHYRRKEVEAKWTRTLPFADYIVDRWDKASVLGFGNGTSIYDSSVVIGDVTVGENTWIGPFTMLDGSGGLEIGSNCSISTGVQIYSHDSVKWAISNGKEKYEYAPTVIGDCCYIGPNVIIQKGVTIGKHVIIGANSLVNCNIQDSKIAYGNPARIMDDSSRILHK